MPCSSMWIMLSLKQEPGIHIHPHHWWVRVMVKAWCIEEFLSHKQSVWPTTLFLRAIESGANWIYTVEIDSLLLTPLGQGHWLTSYFGLFLAFVTADKGRLCQDMVLVLEYNYVKMQVLNFIWREAINWHPQTIPAFPWHHISISLFLMFSAGLHTVKDIKRYISC